MSRRPLLAAAPLVLALLVAGCGGGDEPRTRATTDPSGSASPTPTDTTPTTSASATQTATATGTTAATPTSTTGDRACATKPGVLPDGTWEGPLTLAVRGTTDDQGQGYADAKGTGTLRVAVQDGAVTSGTWTVRWRSEGRVSSGGAASTVRVTGTITGTVRGPARKPVLAGDWRLRGSYTITEPVTASGPIDERGKDSATMKIRDATCTAVTGTFVPSFTSKETLATFGGTATWTGSKVG